MIFEQSKQLSRVIFFSGHNRYEVGVKYHDKWYGSCYLKITRVTGFSAWVKPVDIVNHSSFSTIYQVSKWARKLLHKNTPFLDLLAYGSNTYWSSETIHSWENKYKTFTDDALVHKEKENA